MQLLDFQTPVCPNSLARAGAKYTGLLELAQLPRFAAEVESGQALEATLEFGRDMDGVYINTHLQGACYILCQFCLNSYSYSFSSDNLFRPLLTLEAAREIAHDNEPVLYENGFINIINMLEDEALLSLPNYPKCKECGYNKTA